MSEAARSPIDRLLALPATADLLARWGGDAGAAVDPFEDLYEQLLAHARREPARALEGVLHLQRALAEAGSRLERARLVRLEAHALRAHGRAREAAARYRSAYEQFRRMRNRTEMGRTAIGWTDALALCGELQQAQRAAQLGQRLLPPRDRIARARIDSNLANAWHLAGRWQRAAQLYRSALRRFERGGQPWEAGGAAYNLGLIELKTARPTSARHHFQLAQAALAEGGLIVPAAYARAGLAAADLVEGRWDDGIASVRELRTFFQDVKDDRAVAQMHRDLGMLFLSVGAAEAAEPETASALELYARLGLAQDAAHTALLHGRLLAAMGWRQDAYAQLQQARGHWKQAGHAAFRARVELEIARLLLEQSQVQRSARLLSRCQSALDRFDPHGDGARCRALRAQVHLHSRRFGAARRLAQAAHGSARDYPARLERPRMALLMARACAGGGDAPGALRWAARSVGELEQVLLRFGSRQLRVLVGGARTPIYRDAVELVLTHGGRRGPALAVDLLAKAKSPALIEDLLHGDPNAIRPEARAAITRLRDEIMNAPTEPNDTRHRVLQGHATALESSLGFGVRRAPALIRAAWRRRGLRRWRGAIGQRQLVLYDQAPQGWRAFVLGPQRALRCVELPAADDALRTGWRPLRMTLEAAAHAPAARRAEFLERTLESSRRELALLAQALWEPLGLSAAEVVVVPEGPLHAVPLEALALVGSTSHAVVSRLPHPALLRARRRRPHGQALLLHGAGEQAQGEVDEIRGVLGQAGLSVTVDDQCAALDRARSRLDVLHVSAHGAFHHERWLLSGVSLRDGWLGFERLRRRQLRGALLYFASCESGLAQELPGSDLQGWMTAGLGVGARELVLTLWKVDDRSAGAFAKDFYPRWTRRGAAAAAAAARIAVREDLPHPYHWAPFIAVG